jgi:hypothetical protein
MCEANGYKIKQTSQKQITTAPEMLKITVQSQVLKETDMHGVLQIIQDRQLPRRKRQPYKSVLFPRNCSVNAWKCQWIQNMGSELQHKIEAEAHILTPATGKHCSPQWPFSIPDKRDSEQ